MPFTSSFTSFFWGAASRSKNLGTKFGDRPHETEGSHTPNAETIAAMEEGERIARDPNWPTYTDLDKMWEDLKK